MSHNEIDVLKIYVLLSPLVIGAVALVTVWLGFWMDRHHERRKPRSVAE